MYRTSFARTRLVNYSVFALLIIFITFSSCKKDEEPAPPQNPPPASTAYQFPLTDGSYWIYQQEQTDSLGNVTQTGTTDSVYVEGDTTVGAYTYKKIRTYTAPGNQYFLQQPLIIVRDSAGYIVDTNGKYIAHDNFTDTLDYNNTPGFYDAWYFMRHEDSSITVPAGTFLTIDYEADVYSLQPGYPHPSLRHTHQVFADGVGKVQEVLYFYSQSGYIQRRLITYHIQ